MRALTIRNVTSDDAADLHAIYAHYVLHGFGTFEEVPPGVPSFGDKIRSIAQHGLPFLVAQSGNDVVGYAFASPFRPRSGYRYSVEDSVYVRDDQRGRGFGLQLLKALIPRCEETGTRQVIAVIGDSQNHGSIGLHARAGFKHAGTVLGAGYKLGRWVDIVLMQLALNGGTTTEPPSHGAWT